MLEVTRIVGVVDNSGIGVGAVVAIEDVEDLEWSGKGDAVCVKLAVGDTVAVVRVGNNFETVGFCEGFGDILLNLVFL